MSCSLQSWLTWSSVGSVMNSAFMTSLVGALAGAFAGARAAQHIAERAKESEALLEQLRATNAAMTVAFSICNTFIQLKRQQVLSLQNGFANQVTQLQEFQRKRNAGELPGDQQFRFHADLRSIQFPQMPVEVLQRLVFEKLSLTGRPLALAATIANTIGCVQDLLEKRSELIQQFRAIPPGNDGLTVALYFGLPYAEGRVSTEYKDSVNGLFDQVENGIFFSELLCKDLKSYGDKTLEKYRKYSRKTNERVSEVDFALARQEGLMPDESRFADWLRGFRRADESVTSKAKPPPSR